MPRHNGLAGLLDAEVSASTSTLANSETSEPAKSETSPVAKSKSTSKTRAADAKPAKKLDGPRYLTLVQKTARLTEEQADELTSISRQLNRTRAGAGERITENTLIRVAIDLLISHADDLAGVDEDQLRASVGLPK